MDGGKDRKGKNYEESHHITSRHIFKLLGIVSITAMLIFSITACGPDPEELGTVTIMSEDYPVGPVPAGAQLTAVYDGDEKIEYQWFFIDADGNHINKQNAKEAKDGGNLYTPDPTALGSWGYYYVIVYFKDLDSTSDRFRVCPDFTYVTDVGVWEEPEQTGDWRETITITNNSLKIETDNVVNGTVTFTVTDWRPKRSQGFTNTTYGSNVYTNGLELDIVKKTWTAKTGDKGLGDETFNMTTICIFFKGDDHTSFVRTGRNTAGNTTLILAKFEPKEE